MSAILIDTGKIRGDDGAMTRAPAKPKRLRLPFKCYRVHFLSGDRESCIEVNATFATRRTWERFADLDENRRKGWAILPVGPFVMAISIEV